MANLEQLKNILETKQASLVVAFQDGTIHEYYHNRIIDLISILKENPDALHQSILADKVVGKVAASVMAVAGIKQLHAKTLSKLAIPILENAHIQYTYETMVPYIKNNTQTGMCPMEQKYKEELDINKIYKELIG